MGEVELLDSSDLAGRGCGSLASASADRLNFGILSKLFQIEGNIKIIVAVDDVGSNLIAVWCNL